MDRKLRLVPVFAVFVLCALFVCPPFFGRAAESTLFPSKFFTVSTGGGAPALFGTTTMTVDMYYGNLYTGEDFTTEVHIGRAPLSPPEPVGGTAVRSLPPFTGRRKQ